ncbi:hypothetical protein C8Q80DRAFT_1222247 [Daedaleopsis nitida]|nr:hypothetical protein C8Q80DRAFT_1222247 [Daedaleopsis nitida]
MVNPGQSPAYSTSEMLHPYSYTHSNGSKASISVSVQSAEPHRGRHFEVAHPRPDAGPSSRAAARGIARVASRAPSRNTSRSRSRAHSHTPHRSAVDLPNAPHLPTTPTIGTPGSRQSGALPNGSIVLSAPESIPSVMLSYTDYEEAIYPVLAIPRYDKFPTISPDPGEWSLMPITTHFIPAEDVPDDWTACIHPEGRLYFYNPRRRIYTDCDVREPRTAALLDVFARRIDEKVCSQDLTLPDNYDLVLFFEKRQYSEGYNWIYYCADHATRTLFWVQQCHPVNDLEINDITALKDPAHIASEIEARYWQHIEMYPHGHEISPAVYTELTGMLVFASVDVLTSMTSTVTYRADDVHRMIGLVKTAKSVETTDYAIAIVGRLMNIWTHNRFLNFHGQTHARLGRDQSVYNTIKPRRTPLIRLLAPLFWNAPEVHLRGLEKIWIDGIIAIIPWSGFIGKLQDEWQEFVLYATVLLNANVAFLAIPSVDTGDGTISAAQISSYLSIVTSVGGILLGLLLIRQHRVKSKDTADDANKFLNSHKHEMLGLETLAIIYSLPYAMLMWGMVTFLVAFSLECFGSHNKAALFLTGGVWIAAAILVLWTVITGWESGETPMFANYKQLWAKLVSRHADVTEGQEEVHSATDVSVKERRKWWHILPSHAFPHSADPPLPTTETREHSPRPTV